MLSRRVLVGSLAAVAAGARTAMAQGAGPVWSGLEWVDAAGQPFRLGNLKPKGKLIKLWAHWCPGCVMEMPSLVALADAVGRDKLEVVLISNSDDFARDQALAQRLRLPFRLAAPSPNNRPEQVRAALLDRDGAYVVPRTLLFAGTDNALLAQHTGSRDWMGQVAQIRADLS